MILSQGNFLKDKTARIFMAPCSNSLTGGRKLIMGAGAALALKERFKGADALLGREVYLQPLYYGFAITEYNEGYFVGAFQSKLSWQQPSNYALIGYSTTQLLRHFTDGYGTMIISLAMPGVGLGGLKPDLVSEILSVLPDTVHVWYL